MHDERYGFWDFMADAGWLVVICLFIAAPVILAAAVDIIKALPAPTR